MSCASTLEALLAHMEIHGLRFMGFSGKPTREFRIHGPDSGRQLFWSVARREWGITTGRASARFYTELPLAQVPDEALAALSYELLTTFTQTGQMAIVPDVPTPRRNHERD